MDLLTPEQIREIRNSLIVRFTNKTGSYFDRINYLCSFEERLCRDELICLMNPNFEQIYERFRYDPKFRMHLNIYGKCLYNNFNNGIPEDPISMEPIRVDRVVIIRDYGYDKGTSGRLVETRMKNPITNEYLSANEADEIEKKSALNGNELLGAMYGDEDF